MRHNDPESHDSFERTALRITGGAFYALAAGLVVTALLNVYRGTKPETTVWGIVISAISIVSMWLLIHYKMKIGRQYNSQAVIADANCSRACLYLSVILLASSIGYELTGIGVFDSIGAIGIAVFSYREGREAMEKSSGNTICSCDGSCS